MPRRLMCRIMYVAFPISHTCFFELEIPEYSSIDIMRERLVYAINNCLTIDGDGNRGGATGWDEVDED